MRLLIDNRADINTMNRHNNTPLILSLDGGFDKVAELLIQNGANVNIVGRYGQTALINAAFRGEK